MTTDPFWVIRRSGSADQVLTVDGEWGPMAEVRRFATQEEAESASVPEGTTGEAIQQHPDADT